MLILLSLFDARSQNVDFQFIFLFPSSEYPLWFVHFHHDDIRCQIVGFHFRHFKNVDIRFQSADFGVRRVRLPYMIIFVWGQRAGRLSKFGAVWRARGSDMTCIPPSNRF